MAGVHARRLKTFRPLRPGAFVRTAAFALGMTFGAAAAFAATSFQPPPVPTRQGAPAAPAAAPVNIYTNAHTGYRLFAPPDAKIRESADGLGLTIASPAGYVIKVRAGKTDANVALTERVALFEAANVGPGKRWVKKVGAHATEINGVPAFESLYESNKEVAQATMFQAGGMDYVFLYLTAPATYKSHLGEFYAVLTSFQPPAVAPVQSAEESGKGGADAAHVAAAPPSPDVVKIEPAAVRHHGSGPVKMFADAGFGLAATYPERWTSIRPSRASVLFSGPQGSDAYYATVRVDRIALPPHGNTRQALENAFENQKAQINAETRDPVFFGDRRFHYNKRGLKLDGLEMRLAFSYRNQRFRRWLVILPGPAAAEAFIWTFTAPDASYDRYVDVAEKILNSLTLDNPSEAARRD